MFLALLRRICIVLRHLLGIFYFTYFSRYSRVSPGFVIVPSAFSSVLNVCLVELSILFLKVFSASTELIFSL